MFRRGEETCCSIPRGAFPKHSGIDKGGRLEISKIGNRFLNPFPFAALVNPQIFLHIPRTGPAAVEICSRRLTCSSWRFLPASAIFA
jgi:hypothetical protein